MREEELRSRLQALAVAGRAAPEPAAIGAVRRRARRKLQGGTALVLVGLLVAVGGVWLASEAGHRPSIAPVPPVAPPSGPPAAVATATFVGQVGDGGSRRTVIIDARTGRVVHQVPGSDRRSDLAADAVVGPDLRTMYLPAADPGPASACDAGWTQVDLATGRRQPAFGGLTGVAEFSLSADGRTLAYLHTTAPVTLDRARFEMSCRSELVLASQGCGGGPYDNLLVRFDLETRRVVSTVPLGLPGRALQPGRGPVGPPRAHRRRRQAQRPAASDRLRAARRPPPPGAVRWRLLAGRLVDIHDRSVHDKADGGYRTAGQSNRRSQRKPKPARASGWPVLAGS